MSEAIVWYRAAADRNYAPAQYNLALAYAEGHGTPIDWVAAARWYHRAAEQGLVPAMINLAILYEKGDGVARSSTDAYAWYRTAGERGDPAGAKRAGELLGQFSDADRKRAEALYTETVAAIRPAQTEPLAPSRPAATGGGAPPPPPVLKTGGAAPYSRG
jgi:TPR repeat protein